MTECHTFLQELCGPHVSNPLKKPGIIDVFSHLARSQQYDAHWDFCVILMTVLLKKSNGHFLDYRRSQFRCIIGISCFLNFVPVEVIHLLFQKKNILHVAWHAREGGERHDLSGMSPTSQLAATSKFWSIRRNFISQGHTIVSLFSQNCEKRLFSSSCLYVRSPAWKNSAPIRRIFMKFDIWVLIRKSVEKIQVSWKSGKNNGYFVWRPVYIYYHISLISSWNG